MKLYTTDSLFAWNRLDDSPDLKTVRDFFETLPDGRLLDALQTHRGRGRDDCPIRVLWFCVVLQRLLRHPTMRLTLDELRRNPELRQLGGLEWFGYKLHILCDTRHEVALSYDVSPASKADNEHAERSQSPRPCRRGPRGVPAPPLRSSALPRRSSAFLPPSRIASYPLEL